MARNHRAGLAKSESVGGGEFASAGEAAGRKLITALSLQEQIPISRSRRSAVLQGILRRKAKKKNQTRRRIHRGYATKPIDHECRYSIQNPLRLPPQTRRCLPRPAPCLPQFDEQRSAPIDPKKWQFLPKERSRRQHHLDRKPSRRIRCLSALST